MTHNGASGVYAGCTDLAYQQAVKDGADIIDCSIQMSKDGVAFCFGSTDLMSETTAVTSFMSKSTKIPEIQQGSGIFSFDLTWTEIQTLKPTILSPFAQYGLVRNPAAKNQGKFLMLPEFLNFAKKSSISGISINVERRGRAGRVQPGECYHLYPRCVYDAFTEYQLPELLRTPLNSLCLQIKSLQLGSIGKSAALQPPEALAVQNAVEFLKMIGALDEMENLTNLGRYLVMLPVDPKLGRMLIMVAVFRCLDPILTTVSGLSVQDPFLLPQEKKR